jgi:recombination protein RecA
MKIGVMFGSPETTSGGNALKFYSTVRMDIRRIAAIKEGDVVTGSRTKVKVVKNKVAAPFKTCEFDIIYGEGISFEGDVIDIGAATDIVTKSGTWFSYGDERMGQGKEQARRFLREHPEMASEIAAKIREHFGVDVAPAPAAGAASTEAGAADAAGAAETADAEVVAPNPKKKSGTARARQ